MDDECGWCGGVVEYLGDTIKEGYKSYSCNHCGAVFHIGDD